MIRCFAFVPPLGAPNICTVRSASPPSVRIYASCASASSSSSRSRRSLLSLSVVSVSAAVAISTCCSSPALADFSEIPSSGGVRALDLRVGDGEVPVDGDEVAIHYYGRLAAKQGWRFDSTYDHKDSSGEAVPFTFILGSGKVIRGIVTAVKSMRVGGIRRVIIPPSQGYQNTSQEPLPPNFFDRQRLFTTIFNPTRLANGEGSTLGTLIFDIELVNLRHRP
ncbi:PREDICTED: peptidyl-prolyl cis-trans isomerase FKBP17-1, chloroplastic [Tarenaya hassleriana]|uniref:peptidyl-prolyl cis-trans isomerase FKBP17-1, chloroplastic n=1 Tax=Tarenaya hassleriana TaxID=28532 RepID=UPI00053C6657|nr:PREDICTED: peptidyl-prolyl cis-trans isomerase FKBP17-1, chloroplastic [Tarenaya hassleriana]